MEETVFNLSNDPFKKSENHLPQLVERGTILFLFLILLQNPLFGDGQKIFQTTCTPCHTLSKDRLVGPGLEGVTQKRNRDWLKKFIQSSQGLIKSGDKDAVAIFEEYNKIMMPDQNLNDGDLESLIDFLGSKEKGLFPQIAEKINIQEAGLPSDSASTLKDVQLGGDLFQGKVRLQKGGPACNSCHDVTKDAIIGGGILAVELTKAFSKYGGGVAVKGILNSPPFPVMERAYAKAPLMPEEISALVAFLEDADKNHKLTEMPADYGAWLLFFGILGAGLILLTYHLLWPTRRTESVNQAIYDRQISSI